MSSIVRENDFLLKARAAKDHLEKRNLLKQFFELRDGRRNKFFNETGKKITEAEALWEMLEGGARYFEYGTFRILKDLTPNSKLAKVDPLYGSNKRYRAQISTELMEDLNKDKKRTRYFYTTGFNIYLLLEELNPGFQKTLFDQSPYYGEAWLRTWQAH